MGATGGFEQSTDKPCATYSSFEAFLVALAILFVPTSPAGASVDCQNNSIAPTRAQLRVTGYPGCGIYQLVDPLRLVADVRVALAFSAVLTRFHHILNSAD
jgi:hypothetical protein